MITEMSKHVFVKKREHCTWNFKWNTALCMISTPHVDIELFRFSYKTCSCRRLYVKKSHTHAHSRLVGSKPEMFSDRANICRIKKSDPVQCAVHVISFSTADPCLHLLNKDNEVPACGAVKSASGEHSHVFQTALSLLNSAGIFVSLNIALCSEGLQLAKCTENGTSVVTIWSRGRFQRRADELLMVSIFGGDRL